MQAPLAPSPTAADARRFVTGGGASQRGPSYTWRKRSVG